MIVVGSSRQLAVRIMQIILSRQGQVDNSPALQCWDRWPEIQLSPVGTTGISIVPTGLKPNNALDSQP
jgi:hypothetical protein